MNKQKIKNKPTEEEINALIKSQREICGSFLAEVLEIKKALRGYNKAFEDLKEQSPFKTLPYLVKRLTSVSKRKTLNKKIEVYPYYWRTDLPKVKRAIGLNLNGVGYEKTYSKHLNLIVDDHTLSGGFTNSDYSIERFNLLKEIFLDDEIIAEMTKEIKRENVETFTRLVNRFRQEIKNNPSFAKIQRETIHFEFEDEIKDISSLKIDFADGCINSFESEVVKESYLLKNFLNSFDEDKEDTFDIEAIDKFAEGFCVGEKIKEIEIFLRHKEKIINFINDLTKQLRIDIENKSDFSLFLEELAKPYKALENL